MEDKQHILDKIQKLLKLKDGAEKIGSVGEAIAAAEGVRRLLAQYNLSMEDIPDCEDKSGPEINESGKISYRSKYGMWKRELLTTICNYNFCTCIIQQYYKRMYIVGQVDNVAVIHQLYDYLVTAFERLSKEKWEKFIRSYSEETRQSYTICKWFLSLKEEKKFFRSYFHGTNLGLWENFERRKPTSEVKALMVVHEKAIDEYLAADPTYSGKMLRPVKHDEEENEWAVCEGINDGVRINLDRQISQDKVYQLNKA